MSKCSRRSRWHSDTWNDLWQAGTFSNNSSLWLVDVTIWYSFVIWRVWYSFTDWSGTWFIYLSYSITRSDYHWYLLPEQRDYRTIWNLLITSTSRVRTNFVTSRRVTTDDTGPDGMLTRCEWSFYFKRRTWIVGYYSKWFERALTPSKFLRDDCKPGCHGSTPFPLVFAVISSWGDS